MSAPERIWTNFKEANRLFVAYDEPPESGCEDCGQPYILATPEALAASPEVAALIRAAVQAERDAVRAELREAMMQSLADLGQAQEAYAAQRTAEAERDAARAELARVNSLVWEEVCCLEEHTGGYEADCGLGSYVIDIGLGPGGYYWSVMSPDHFDIGSDFEDPEYAKAAAQADYEARIRAALTTQEPKPKEPHQEASNASE